MTRAVCVLCFVIGCASPQSDATPPSTAVKSEKVEPAKSEAAKKVEPAKSEPAKKVEPAKAEPKLGRDHKSFVACASDADCGWDDPCVPTRCVEPNAGRASCEETSPEPGTCRCVAGGCTLEPKVIPEPSGTCEIRGCEVDRAAGRCVADTGGVPENIRARPGIDVGPSCDCITPSKGCTFTWFPAVSCKDDRDCWVDPSPRRHPVARPKALRKRDFKPCSDGEVAPKCGPAGTCILGPAYTC